MDFGIFQKKHFGKKYVQGNITENAKFSIISLKIKNVDSNLEK